MAANKSQGSFYTLFLVAATVLCAGIYSSPRHGKVVVAGWCGGPSWQPFRNAEDQAARRDGRQ